MSKQLNKKKNIFNLFVDERDPSDIRLSKNLMHLLLGIKFKQNCKNIVETIFWYCLKTTRVTVVIIC